MASLFEYSDLTGMISFDEVCQARNNAQANLADAVLNMEYNALYKLDPNACSPSQAQEVHCLYLYLYALDTWEENLPNFLTETQLAAILVNVEQLSKRCCCE